MDQNPLANELAFFDAHVAEWLTSHRGKFALIKGDALIDVFDTDQAAYEAGVKKWGNVPMLIRLITDTQPVQATPALTHGVLFAHP
jgi:hypothetical protein